MIITTRQLHTDDVTALVQLAYKALVENGLIDTDFDEPSFYTHIKKALVSPFYQGSVGLFKDDQLIGFSILNYNGFPWAPKKKVATLMYYYLQPDYTTAENTAKLFEAVEDWCMEYSIEALRVSSLNITDHSLISLGFEPEERIFKKTYGV